MQKRQLIKTIFCIKSTLFLYLDFFLRVWTWHQVFLSSSEIVKIAIKKMLTLLKLLDHQQKISYQFCYMDTPHLSVFNIFPFSIFEKVNILVFSFLFGDFTCIFLKFLTVNWENFHLMVFTLTFFVIFFKMRFWRTCEFHQFRHVIKTQKLLRTIFYRSASIWTDGAILLSEKVWKNEKY